MTTNFHLAPPARLVDGLWAVPIDISLLDAHVTFDLASRTAEVTATMQFVVGATGGCPIFDLRQPIATATLDGVALTSGQLAHHDFGGGLGADLRVVASSLAAGTSHTLVVTYPLGQPQSPSSQPIGWDPASPRVVWELWFSDLKPARYLEMWFPANLVFDQFAFHLEVTLVNTAVAHRLITNGSVTDLGANHWQVEFPARFTALSPMLLLAADDRLERRTGTATLPTTGAVTLETCQLVGTGADLAAVEAEVAGYLVANEAEVGPYVHGDRFTTFVWSNPTRSMEYDGAVTSNTGSLRHEVFHSWFARGVKPASQPDGWVDEAWTTYHDGGGSALDPFDLGEPTMTLAPANPYRRVTAGDAYTGGARFFAGLAATLGLDQLRSAMVEVYSARAGGLTTTAELEALLIQRSGALELVDYFDHYVHGEDGPADVRLSMRDDVADPGTGAFGGAFWASPDLWVRRSDDDGSEHQDPEYGQDNWFHARIRNLGTAPATSVAVTFQVAAWAGTQFVFPHDFVPPIAVAITRGLGAGETRVVKARWPAARVPAAGTHGCLLACAYARNCATPAGARVWEQATLAQRNLTIVDLLPGDSIELPFHVGNRWGRGELHRLELWRPAGHLALEAALTHAQPATLLRLLRPALPTAVPAVTPPAAVRVLTPTAIAVAAGRRGAGEVRVELAPGSVIHAGPPTTPAVAPAAGDVDLVEVRGKTALRFRPGRAAGLPLVLHPRSQLRFGLRLTAPADARPGEVIDVDVVQRDGEQRVIGGIRVRIRVRAR